MKNLILLLTLCFFVFQAFSTPVIEEPTRADVYLHHSKKPVVFKVNVAKICPELNEDIYFFHECTAVKAAIKNAETKWNAVAGSDFEFDIQFSDDEGFSGQVPPKRVDGVNIIDHTLGSSTGNYSIVTITNNDEGEILDVDIQIRTKRITEVNLYKGTATESRLKRKLVYEWVLLHALGQALGLASRTSTANSEIITGSVMDTTFGNRHTTVSNLLADDKAGALKIYKNATTTTTEVLNFGDDEKISLTAGNDSKIVKFTVPNYVANRYLTFKGAVSDFFNSVKLELPSGYDVPYGKNGNIGNSSLGNEDAIFGFMRYAHPGEYSLIFEKPASAGATDIWVLVDLSKEVRFDDDDDEYYEEPSVFQKVTTLTEDVALAAGNLAAAGTSFPDGDIHHYLFRVLKEGELVIESTSSDDMVGDWCEYDSGGGSDCDYDDDSGDSTNFKLTFDNVEPGEYILSVRQYRYGAATYGLKYSFDVP